MLDTEGGGHMDGQVCFNSGGLMMIDRCKHQTSHCVFGYIVEWHCVMCRLVPDLADQHFMYGLFDPVTFLLKASRFAP